MFFKNKLENSNMPDKLYELSENTLIEKELIPLFWWDESKNFGDWIGPYLVSKLTTKSVFNTKQFPVMNNNFFTVGSICNGQVNPDSSLGRLSIFCSN